MTHFVKSIFIASFLYSQAHASVFQRTAPLFYKSPLSQFSSGQTSQIELEKRKIRSETLNSFQVTWGKNEYSIKHDELLREIQVADQVSSSSPSNLYLTPSMNSHTTGQMQKGEVFKLLEIQNSWGHVENKMKNQKGYVKLDMLESFSEDKGVGFSITSLFLKENLSDNSKVLTTIPQKQRLQILEWKKDKIYVKYREFHGFVENALVYTKADFASWALHEKKGWIQIQHREGYLLKTQESDYLPVEQFKAFITNKYRAFSLINIENGPKVRSKLEIKNLAGHIWNVSYMPEHGEVWWKNPNIYNQNISSAFLSLKTEDILKRQIYSMAFYPDKKIKGLISASGVFRTEDGINWQSIDIFKNENWPVSITSDKIWIVGNFRSLDEGKTFEPFIRWEKLSEMVHRNYSQSPKFLKILKLEAKADRLLDLWIDTGYKKIKVQHSFANSSWKIIR